MKLFRIRFFDGMIWDWQIVLVVASDFDEACSYIYMNNHYHPHRYTKLSDKIFYLEHEWYLKPGIVELG
jgi:hypothetical protein